jgi:hypothetical protein
VLILSGGDILESADSVQAVLPGAFNPLHEGHRRMALLAERAVAAPVAFELSIDNVDKPPLDIDAVEQRLFQFDQEHTICLTRAATFVQKAQLFAGAHFLVGADTILRVADPRYYAGDERERDAAIDQLVNRGARFLVFGRTIGGRFHSLTQLALPERLHAICSEVLEGEFRVDVSSTDIRRANTAGGG